ncbi:Uncharacterised protein g10700 [Pycnogonum litorale]
MPKFIWTLFWLLVLIFISFFVACFCAPIYILLIVFTPCIGALNGITELLMKGINFPNFCSKGMVRGCSYESI